MEKVLKPQHLDADPGLKTAADEFKHWLKTFEDYLDALSAADLEPDKYKVLTNLVVISSLPLFRRCRGL